MKLRCFGCSLAALVLVMGACAKSERDLPTDPIVDPFIIPIDAAAFETSDGSVTMSWQHIGNPVARFRIIRTEFRPAFENTMDWIDVIVHSPSPESDVQPILSFSDTSARAGESYDYAVETTERVLLVGPEAMGSVSIPGVRIEGVDLRFRDASAAVSWQRQGTLPVQSTGVHRRVDGGPLELRFETQDPQVTSFRDTELIADRRYEFIIRTDFQNGLSLVSIPIVRGFFLAGSTVRFDDGFPVHLRLTSHSSLTNASLPGTGAFLRLAVVTQQGDIAVQRFSANGDRYGFPGNLRGIGSISPNSLSFAVQPLGEAQLVLAFIEDGQVKLQPYAIPNTEQRLDPFGMPAIRAVAITFSGWPVGPDVTRTALIVSEEGDIYISAGSTLRVLTSELESLGEIHLGVGSSVTSFAVDDENNLWATLEAGQILRTPPLVDDGELLAPVWETIALPSGATPTSLLYNGNGVMLALDEGNRRVLAYDLDGNRIMDWGGFDALRLEDGLNGLMTAGDAVYVWDSGGIAAEFRNEAEGF